MGAFNLGKVYFPPGVLPLGPDAFEIVIRRHAMCDWSEMSAEDAQANRDAIHSGERILSAYEVKGERVWVITEADRSATTVLLPEEY